MRPPVAPRRVELERGTGVVFVFDPNGDNAFLMGGNSKNANAIWLLNWLKALAAQGEWRARHPDHRARWQGCDRGQP